MGYQCVMPPNFLGCVPPAAARSLAICALYGTVALSLMLLNKALLSIGKFDCYFTLVGTKLALLLTLCEVTRRYFGNPLAVPKIDPETLRSSLPMSLLFVANAVTGFVGLMLVSVPLFNCLRRLVPACILAYEWYTLGKVADRSSHIAVALIAFGALLAGWGTFSSDFTGVALTMANNLATAASLVVQKSFSEKAAAAVASDAAEGEGVGIGSSSGKASTANTQPKKLGTWAVLYYTALIALPISVVLAIATGEVPQLMHHIETGSPRFWAGFWASSALGLALTFSSSLCNIYVSPMATSITGNVKDIATTTAGALLFPGFIITAQSLSGLLLSFSGAFLYSYTGLKKQQALQAQAQADAGEGKASGAAEEDDCGSTGEARSPARTEKGAFAMPSTSLGGGRAASDDDEEEGGERAVGGDAETATLLAAAQQLAAAQAASGQREQRPGGKIVKTKASINCRAPIGMF